MNGQKQDPAKASPISRNTHVSDPAQVLSRFQLASIQDLCESCGRTARAEQKNTFLGAARRGAAGGRAAGGLLRADGGLREGGGGQKRTRARASGEVTTFWPMERSLSEGDTSFLKFEGAISIVQKPKQRETYVSQSSDNRKSMFKGSRNPILLFEPAQVWIGVR